MLPPQRLGSSSRAPSIDPDDAIRATDDDAAASRLSAVNLGYLPDPFLPFLYRPPLSSSTPSSASAGGPSRKPPLINVGTHHRTVAVDRLVRAFLDEGGRQVVSLGAGSDTRFWRLMSQDPQPNIARYVEVDFPHQTSQKAQRIARTAKLHSVFHSPSNPSSSSPPSSTPSSATPPAKPYTVSNGGTTLHADRYSLLPLDLRDPSALSALDDLLDPSLPTLLLAECVFCYMKPEETDAVLRWFGRFNEAGVVVYEMVGLEDQFGQVMKRNLATRNLTLPGAVFRTAQDQANRFQNPALSEGVFTSTAAKTLWEIHTDVIPQEELQRIAALEHLDEIEELRLVLSHYCVAWGTRGEVLSGMQW